MINDVLQYYIRMEDFLNLAYKCASRNMTLTETEEPRFMNGDYRPTCPEAPIPPNAVQALVSQASN